MDFQKMVQAMQKVQRAYEKERGQLEEKEYSHTVSGAISITLKGNMTLVKLEILDDSLLSVENKEMLIDMITLAYTTVKDQIMKEDEELSAKYQNQSALGQMF